MVMTESGTDWKPGVSFNFKGSPIDPEWKERIVQKLNSMPEVFAKNDPNFGRIDQIKHQIKLSDDTPFKHKASPIHPNDLEAVKISSKSSIMLE